MTKKSARNDRQAVMEQIRKKQKSADRRRNFVIVGVCVAIAAVILAAAVIPILQRNVNLSEYDELALGEIGAPASVCGEITTEAAEPGDHRPETEQIAYAQAPPATGPHWNVGGLAPDPMERKFYTSQDRPELEALVHNSEHGYNILWYDETVAENDDMLNQIEAIARKFPGTENFRHKFKAVPWTSEDAREAAEAGAENDGNFPEGQHIAFTHWTVGGAEKAMTQAAEPKGVWQYCSDVSGEALEAFMLEYPYMDSPEPNSM